MTLPGNQCCRVYQRIYLYIGTALELLHIAITDINQLITLNLALGPSGLNQLITLNLALRLSGLPLIFPWPAKQTGGLMPACLMLLCLHRFPVRPSGPGF
jgi:hypothetical protein